MDKQSYAFPLFLLFGGLAAALYIAWLAALDPSVEYCVSFAIACVVSAIGYAEKVAAAEFNERIHGGR